MYLLKRKFPGFFALFSGQPKKLFSSFLGNPERMHQLLRKTLVITASLAFASFTAGSAFGQAAKAEAQPPEFDVIPSPIINSGKAKDFKPKDWLEVEAKLKVQLAPEPASKTCDRLTVKWYVAVKNPDKPGTFLLLTKDIEHVNVPLNEEIYSSVYLSPASLKRITGSENAGKNAVEYVGLEVLVNGERVAAQTNKGKLGWWAAASDKISRSETVPLLTKAETPFSILWWDRYAEVAPATR